MSQPSPRSRAALLLLIAIVGLAAALPARAQEPAAGPQRVYLPLLRNGESRNVFGVEVSRLSEARGFDLLRAAGTRWVRRNGLRWKDVEPVEGAGYSWDAPRVQSLEQDFRNASENGMNLVLVVRGSPPWATSPHKSDCAPISPAKYAAFAKFLAAAVERYSRPPYNVTYWEIGNEPDAFIFPSDSPFGCWGVKADPYYGGEAYGRVLAIAAAAMRRVNPEIKILNGGLLLDRAYDPADPASLSGRFFEGVLRGGGGGAIDILSFHTYVFFRTPGLPPLGARDDWRVAYLQRLLKQYGAGPKPFIRTEAGLLCVEVDAACRWAQADMVGRLYARTLRDELLGNIWYIYDNDTYHNTALIEPGDVFVPRPAYFAYRHAATLLSDARYDGPIPGLPAGVEGYRFRRGAETLLAYWTDSAGSVGFSVPLPAGARPLCTNRDGGAVPCAASGGRLALQAAQSPQYVQIR